jgi:hypothetical protein
MPWTSGLVVLVWANTADTATTETASVTSAATATLPNLLLDITPTLSEMRASRKIQ